MGAPERAQHTTHHTWSVLAQVVHCAKNYGEGAGPLHSAITPHPPPPPKQAFKYLTAATQVTAAHSTAVVQH